jgi:hypothetical protein
VIFVHGLGGHAYETWQRGSAAPSFWPMWLAGCPGADGLHHQLRGAALELAGLGASIGALEQHRTQLQLKITKSTTKR